MAVAASELGQPRSGALARLGLLPVYWHLLSLDAPTVAALWCWSFARVLNVPLARGAPLLLALGTWLVYIADRLLDGLPGAHAARLRARHHFYARHRAAFLALGAAGGLLLLWLVTTRMAPAVRREDTVLFAVALVYFVLVHSRTPRIDRWLSKELAVGVLFAMATAVPAWARIEHRREALAPLVALFAMLCWLNCAGIDKWEQPLGARTGVAGARFPAFCIALATTALALAAISNAATRMLLSALSTSSLLLLWLDRRSRRSSPMFLRVAADAALLTPMAFLHWLR